MSALALVPLALTLATAVQAPRMHVLLDFWHVLAKITADDGSLQPQVLTYHLDQPFLVPSLLFWADAAWFGGDNRVLTVLSVVLAAGIVLLVRSMLPADQTPLLRAGLTVAFAFAVLSSQATELWIQGTNGISWLPAILASVLAIALAHRGRTGPACAAAAFGCLCFGAAFPSWFAIALIAWLRRDSLKRILLPLAAGLAVLVFWLITKPGGEQSLASSELDPDGRLSVFFAALGGLFTPGTAPFAIFAGAAVFAVLASALRTSDREGAGFIGLGGHAIALAVMIALGRTTPAAPEGNVGLVSRYVIVSALATSAALALISLRRPQLPARQFVLAVVTLGLVTNALGGTRASAVRNSYAPLALAAPALRAEAPDVLAQLHIEPGVIPAARALGTYPFTDDYIAGCGHRLGDIVDLAAIPILPNGVDRSDSLLTGRATVNGQIPRCVLVTDHNGTVIGSGIPLPDGGWQAVAPPGAAGPVVLAGDTSLYRLTN